MVGAIANGVSTAYYDCVMAIDLTAAIGAGNETTVVESQVILTANGIDYLREHVALYATQIITIFGMTTAATESTQG